MNMILTDLFIAAEANMNMILTVPFLTFRTSSCSRVGSVLHLSHGHGWKQYLFWKDVPWFLWSDGEHDVYTNMEHVSLV